MPVWCVGDELYVDTVHTGWLKECRGFGQLHLIKGKASVLRKAVEWAVEWAETKCVYGVLVSFPGSGAWIAGMGFAVAEQSQFRPRLADLNKAAVMRLPHVGNAKYVHNGETWRRETLRKRPKHVWGTRPALGFELEVDGGQHSVSVQPGPNILVNGSTIKEDTELVDQDTITHRGRVLTVYMDTQGRSTLPDYYMRWTGMGWNLPGFTRAVRMFTTP